MAEDMPHITLVSYSINFDLFHCRVTGVGGEKWLVVHSYSQWTNKEFKVRGKREKIY